MGVNKVGSGIKCRRVHQSMRRQTCSPAADKTAAAAAASADNCRYRYQPLSLSLVLAVFQERTARETEKDRLISAVTSTSDLEPPALGTSGSSSSSSFQLPFPHRRVESIRRKQKWFAHDSSLSLSLSFFLSPTRPSIYCPSLFPFFFSSSFLFLCLSPRQRANTQAQWPTNDHQERKKEREREREREKESPRDQSQNIHPKYCALWWWQCCCCWCCWHNATKLYR